MEGEKLPFEDETVDILIVNQILEHCKEIFWIFHELTRVLKVNGILIVGVPNLGSFHNRILLILGKQPSCIKINSAHVRGFTYSGLNNFLNQIYPEGYEIKKFNGSKFYPFSSSIAKILSWLFPAISFGIFFKFKKTLSYKYNFLVSTKNLDTNYFSNNLTN